jgi:hypothetical protein
MVALKEVPTAWRYLAMVPAFIVQQRREPPLPRCMAYNASWSVRRWRGSWVPVSSSVHFISTANRK